MTQQKQTSTQENTELPFTMSEDKQSDEQPSYEEVKSQNRRRLVGAGVVSLVVAGLFAIIASNHNASSQNAASEPQLNTAPSEPAVAQNTEPTPDTASTVPATSLVAASAVQAASNTASLASAPVANMNAASTPTENIAQPNAQNTERMQREQNELAMHQAEQQQIAQHAQLAQQNAKQTRANERAQITQKSEPNTAPSKKNNSTSPVATDKVTTKTISKPTPKPVAPTAKNISTARLAVQAGAFSTRANADKAYQQIKKLGLNATITEVKTPKGTLYRVQAAGFNNRADAQNAANKMKSNGLHGMIVGK